MTPRLLSPAGEGCERTYETEAREFVLSIIRVRPGQPCRLDHQGRVSILLCTEGDAVMTEQDSGEVTAITRGVSVLIPASAGQYTLSGEALIFKAGVPF
jgi:mannose-6-phosphate isomerase